MRQTCKRHTLHHSRVLYVGSAKYLNAKLTDDSLLIVGVTLADGVPLDAVLREGGVLWTAMLPDDDPALPDMLPNEGDPGKNNKLPLNR